MTLKKLEEEIIKEFIEKGADLEHDRWSRWQKYMFSKCQRLNGGILTIPEELVKRWFRQIDTKYLDLSEQEKESDRKETRNYVPLLQEVLSRQRQEISKIVEKQKETANEENNDFNNGYLTALSAIQDKLK